MILTAAAWILGIGAVLGVLGAVLSASLSGAGVASRASGPAPAPAVVATDVAGVAGPGAVIEPPVVLPEPAAPVVPAPAPTPAVRGVVCIDPGHQAKGDSSQEPVGPGASETKPKVSGGTRGVASGLPESQTVLAISLKLRDELVRRGITVVMVRETQDVNIANSERAAVANNAKADVFIRIHCDGADNRTSNGLSTLVPKSNSWTAPIVDESRRAAEFVHPAVIAATGAKDNGIVGRSDLSGFNWATVPTMLVETGFMTNPDEDRRLNDPAYQQQLAVGMANGIVAYLQAR